jgi:hypothetical protein
MAKCLFPISTSQVSGTKLRLKLRVYEAAAFAIQVFKAHDCEPGAMANLEVEIRTSITHTLTVKKLRDWLNGACRSPNERVTKERLKELIQ